MLILIKFATWILSPLGIVLGFAVLGIALRKIRPWAFGAAALSLLIFSNEYIAHRLLLPLEQEAVTLSETRKAEWALRQQRPSAIVVLGGGMSPAIPPLRPFPEIHDAADRVWHGARLFKQGLAPQVVVSGGKGPGLERAELMTEAEAMKLFLMDLGVPSQAILLETESRTTRENATQTAAKLREQKTTASGAALAVILVTSASHMPRALRNFEAEGFAVLPHPTDFQSGIKDKPLYRLLLPSEEALQKNQSTIKEWLAKWIGY